MIPVYCLTNKDCLRASLASLLELDYYSVGYVDPDLSVEDFWSAYHNELNRLGFEFIFLDASDFITGRPLKGFAIGIGKTPSGIDHAVVCENGNIVHNPSKTSIISKVEHFMLLVPMQPWRHK